MTETNKDEDRYETIWEGLRDAFLNKSNILALLIFVLIFVCFIHLGEAIADFQIKIFGSYTNSHRDRFEGDPYVDEFSEEFISEESVSGEAFGEEDLDEETLDDISLYIKILMLLFLIPLLWFFLVKGWKSSEISQDSNDSI